MLKKKLNKTGKANLLKLKRMGVFIPYMANAKRRFGRVEAYNFLRLINNYRKDIINKSFLWEATPQGWRFWSDKNNDFINLKKI